MTRQFCYFCTIQQRKKPVTSFLSWAYGGKKGIRTLEGFRGPTRFPVVRLRPAQPSFHILMLYRRFFNSRPILRQSGQHDFLLSRSSRLPWYNTSNFRKSQEFFLENFRLFSKVVNTALFSMLNPSADTQSSVIFKRSTSLRIRSNSASERTARAVCPKRTFLLSSKAA